MPSPSARAQLILAVLLAASVSEARYDLWPVPNGLPVREGVHIEWNEALVVGLNGYYTAWSESRDGELDVFVQGFSADGTALWSDGGIQVSSGAYGQRQPAITFGQDEAIYVAINDQREDPEGLGLMLATMQKVSMDGTPLWGSAPHVIHAEPRMWSAPTLHSAMDDGVFLLLEDGWQAVIHKVSPSGEQLYGEAGIAFEAGMNKPTLVSDLTGGVWVLSQRFVPGGQELRLQHYDGEGLALWDEPLTLTGPHSSAIRYSAILTPGDELAVAWTSYDPLAEEHQVRMTLLDGEGESVWQGVETVVIRGESTFDQLDLQILEGDPVLAASRPQSSSSHSLYVQRIGTLTDSATLLWDEAGPGSGKLVAASLSGFRELLQDADPLGTTIAWLQETTSGMSRVRAARIDQTGETVWSETAELPVDGVVRGIRLVNHGNRAVFVYQQQSNARAGLNRSALLHASGAVETPAGGVEFSGGMNRNTVSQQIVRSDNAAYVGWLDERFAGLGRLPYVQKMDMATGETVHPANGISLLPAYPFSGGDTTAYFGVDRLKLAADETGGVFAVWLEDDLATSRRTARGQHLTADGTLGFGEQGALLLPDDTSFEMSVYPFHLFSDGEGGFLTFFTVMDRANDWQHRPVMQHLNAAGESLYEESAPRTLNATGQEQVISEALQLPDGNLFLLLHGQAGGEPSLLMRRYSPQGEPILESFVTLPLGQGVPQGLRAVAIGDEVLLLWRQLGADETGIRFNIVDAEGGLRFPIPGGILLPERNDIGEFAVGSGDESFWFAWSGGEEMGYQQFNLDGQPLLEPSEGRIVPVTGTFFFTPELMADGGGGMYIIGASGTCCNELDYSYTHIGPNGELVSELYAEQGILPLVNTWYPQRAIALAPDGSGGFLATWSDNRSSLAEDVYAMRVNDFLAVSAPEKPLNVTPIGYALLPAYPNPFNPTTTIRFNVPEAGDVRLTVYDLLGRRVTRLLEAGVEPGLHTILWNGQDFSGQRVSSGVYFVTMRSGTFTATRRVVLLQ